jgi:hypothetical protein
MNPAFAQQPATYPFFSVGNVCPEFNMSLANIATQDDERTANMVSRYWEAAISPKRANRVDLGLHASEWQGAHVLKLADGR